MNNFWQDRSVLVTGCTGLLGSWMTQELVDRGAKVIGLVRDWVPQSRLFQTGLEKKITTVYGRIEDLSTLERIVNEHEVETVFHLAAQIMTQV
jgi:CDP-glucose 4,6-dehydratase